MTTIIFSGEFKDQILAGGETVVVAVSGDGHAVSAGHRFGTYANGCFVQKLQGPDTLVIS